MPDSDIWCRTKSMEKDNQKELHPRNIHNQKYDFELLIKDHPDLSIFVKKNQYDALTIDYSDANAIFCLNQALIAHYYKVKNWSVPKGNLCPPIPGRADYIHYIADILSEGNNNKTPVGTKVKGLDIGTGASCIYPILGNSIYGWKFVGSDISSHSLNHVKEILNSNQTLKKNIKTRFQKDESNIFKELIKPDEKFDFTMCNPPFFSSLEEANEANERKVHNLNKNKDKKGHKLINRNKPSNFGGVNKERWCLGGEFSFIKSMINESLLFKNQCNWFSTLVSNKSHLDELQKLLQSLMASDVRVIVMNQGQKIVHVLAWRY
jgi:23S rRNA (adenine1618-N6)-methyltransferase